VKYWLSEEGMLFLLNPRKSHLCIPGVLEWVTLPSKSKEFAQKLN
jgi:hypothetical protein